MKYSERDFIRYYTTKDRINKRKSASKCSSHIAVPI